MKILIIVDQFPKLSESFIINHITGLLDSGYDVRIIARKTKPDRKSHPKVNQYRLLEITHYFELPSNYFVRLIEGLIFILKSKNRIELLKSISFIRYGPGVLTLQSLFRCNYLPEENFDLIHCHYGNIAWNCLNLRRRYNAPLVTSFHGTEFLRYSRMRRLLYWHLFHFGDGFIANSEFTKKLMEDAGCPSQKIEKIPVIANNFQDDLTNKKINLKKPMIITVARLDKTKGVQHCIFALKKLHENGYRFKYKIIGDGPYREILKFLAKNLNLNSIIEFTGWLDQKELNKVYKNADILVLPSIKGKDGWIETQGLVIQEAQRCCVLVIGSDIGGIPEGLDYGKVGILFKTGNFDDLAKKIKWVIDNPILSQNLARLGQNYFFRKYSKNTIMNRLNSFYKKFLYNKNSS